MPAHFDARLRQGALLVGLCLFGIFLVSYVLDNHAQSSAATPVRQNFLLQAAAPLLPSSSPRRPRLAAMVLAHRDPSPAIRQFVDNYLGSHYDLFVLHNGLHPDTAAAIAALVRNVTFVDISAHFDSSLLVHSSTVQTCSSSTGYHLMCRFMSGPVYWLPEFDAYDQVVRFDDDSRWTAPITQSLELNGSETYAYALKQQDSSGCVWEARPALPCNSTFNNQPPPPPFLYLLLQLPGGLSGAGALAVQWHA